VHCGKGRECQVGADGAARCSCVTSCAKHRQHQVCGSDGLLYHNHCELHRASCLLRRPLAVDRTMACLNAGTKFSSCICANDKHGRKRTPKTSPQRNKTRVRLCSTRTLACAYAFVCCKWTVLMPNGQCQRERLYIELFGRLERVVRMLCVMATSWVGHQNGKLYLCRV
jgi:hypothetical protein